MRAREATSVDTTGSCCLLVWTRAHKRIMCPGSWCGLGLVWVLVLCWWHGAEWIMDGVNPE